MRYQKAALVHTGIAESRIHSIPCGVDIGELPNRPNHGRVRFLSVGRLTGKKGPIFVLDAFRRTLEWAPESELDMVGDGELAEAVRQFIRAFSLRDRVRLHGSQRPAVVQQLIREADVFLQHSVINTTTGDEEGLPVAILEAMAGGLPVVSTLHAGIPEAVVDGETGFLVAEGDTSAMAARMSRLARNHPLRVEMGARGFARARERFTWSRERELLLDVMRISGGQGGKA